MKLKTIESLIKKAGSAVVVEGADELWLGNGAMLAPVYEFRRLDNDQLRAVLNISEKEAEKISITRTGEIDLTNDAPGEELLDLPLLTLEIEGRQNNAYASVDGICYVRTELLAPFLSDNGPTLLYRRKTDRGEVIAIKRGFLLAGLVQPSAVATPNLLDTLGRLYEQTALRVAEMAAEPTLLSL